MSEITQERPLQAPSPPGRRSRIWLYAPYVVLLGLALAWSVGWFVIRGRVVGELDAWLASESALGRRWDCPGRSVAGYPFRIEIACDGLALARGDLDARLGRLVVVAQIYDPSHVIAEVTGPLRVTSGTTLVEARWRLLQTSVHTLGGRPQRGDLVAEAPVVTVTLGDGGPVQVSANRLEAHLRPSPTEPGTVDVALQLGGAVIPNLDALIGGTEPADLDLVGAITQARDLPARPIPAEFERWRASGGRVEIARLALAKGPRRLQASGQLGLDDLHRPEGRLQAASAGIEGLLGRYVGGRAGGVAGLLGTLLGGGRPAEPQAPRPGEPALTALPPVRVANGRISLGPLQLPQIQGLRIEPLY